MWESDSGRGTMPPWGRPHEPVNRQPALHDVPTYAVGDAIYSGNCRGTVTKVSTVVARLISVVWSDGDGGEIIYPMDATYLRKGLPWE